MVISDDLTRRQHAAAVVTTVVLLLLPLLFVVYPPLNDYPFHLARIHILHQWDDLPAFRDWYQQASFVLPNVGVDVIGLALVQFLSPQAAGLVIVGFIIVVTFTGTLFLHWCLHSRLSLWPFVAAFFIFNWMLLFGFLSYLIGVGLMLWSCGAWVLLSQRGILMRLICGTLISIVLFFCHLVPLGLYAVFVAGFELQRAVGTARVSAAAAVRDLVVGALPFVAPLALFLVSQTSQGGGGIEYSANWFLMKFLKIRVLLSADWVLDVSLVVVILAAFLTIWRFGSVRFANSAILPLALLIVVYFAVPLRALTATYIDTRLPAAIMFVAIASLQVDIRGLVWRRAATAVLLAYLAFRAVFLSYQWHGYSDQIVDISDALSALPERSILFTASAVCGPEPSDIDMFRWQPTLTYVASLASLEKPIFAVNTYAHKGQQPLVIQPQYKTLYDLQDNATIDTPAAEDVANVAEQARELATRDGVQNTPMFLLLLYPSHFEGNVDPAIPEIMHGEQFAVFALNNAASAR